MDRNFDVSLNYKEVLSSLSARRAWIEMLIDLVDSPITKEVALRKESVDRNRVCSTGTIIFCKVALRKESVDRNGDDAGVNLALGASLSARRAWIEMNINGPMSKGQIVALRKESVDRNTQSVKGAGSLP